jgi:competence protein ComEC
MPRSGWLAIGAVVGAIAVAVDHSRVSIVATAGMALTLIASLALKGGTRPALIALSIGTAAIVLRATLLPGSSGLEGTPAGSGPWRMVIESIGSPREGHQVATLRTVADDGSAFRLWATLPRYPPVEPGDVVDVGGRTRPRPDSPYGAYLERLGAWGTVDARTLELIHRPTDPATHLERLRRETGAILARVLPEPEAGLAAGILIGLRDRVDRDVAAAFTTAGVSHVVAISGWNIAIVAAAIAALAGSLGRRRRTVVTAIAIVGYIVFAGASPSVLRAGAMAGVVLLARESGRAGRAAAALGWAAALLLLADPSLIGDAGFQLSSLATGGLIAWATPITERLDRWTGGHLPRWLSESLGVSLAAQVATLPVVLASFGRLAVIAPLVNLLVVPLVAPAMAAGLLALAGGALVAIGLPEAIGSILAAPGWVALRSIIGIVDVAAAMPIASVEVEPPVGTALGIGTGTLIVALVAWRPRLRSGRRPAAGAQQRSADPNHGSRAFRLATFGLVVTVALVGAAAVTRPSGLARISVLDVGQGDAILVEGSRGGRLLVDGGPDPDRLLVQLDRRIPPWDRRIDVVILTHPHEDHVAGLALLLARYRVERVLEPGMRGPGPGYAAWLDRLGQKGSPPHLAIAAGDRMAVDEIGLRVLWPIRGQVPVEPPDSGTGINNVSVVLLGTIGERRFLLAGDVEEDIDPSLLSAGLPRLDLLKVAHHGSRTATTESFVKAVRPRVAVASAGADNRYGHPARSTMDRLAAVGARVYRTDRDGTVTVSFAQAGMTVKSEPRRADRVVPTVPAAARATPGQRSGPRRAFGCAIPIAPVTTGVPPAPRLATGRPAGDEAALRYHRDHAAQRPECTVRDRPAALRLGRRRTRGRAFRQPLRGRPRGSVRRSAGTLGPAGEARYRGHRRGAALRAAGDTGHVRRRDACGGLEPGRPGAQERNS